MTCSTPPLPLCPQYIAYIETYVHFKEHDKFNFGVISQEKAWWNFSTTASSNVPLMWYRPGVECEAIMAKLRDALSVVLAVRRASALFVSPPSQCWLCRDCT